MTDEQREIFNEKRLQRVETYLYLLCKHLGLDPRNGKRLAGDMEVPAKHGSRT